MWTRCGVAWAVGVEPMTLTGGCLCGAVAYQVRPPFLRFVNCHCSRCRRASGSSHAANAVVAPGTFRWTRGGDAVRRFDLPGARSFSVAFCGICGSQLPHATRSGREVIVPCGGLDGDPGQRPSAQVHWGSRAPWTGDAGGLPTTE